jgi:membrane protease YdiL (CAAX protease family)
MRPIGVTTEETGWKKRARAHILLAFFVMAYAITWSIGGLRIFAPGLLRAFSRWPALTNPLFYLAVYAPTLSALLLTAVLGGRAALRKLFGRFVPRQAAILWSIFILIAYPLAGIAAGEIAMLFGGPPVRFPNWPHFYASLLPALFVDPGPLGEELGWRGFALPRMLERWPPLTASLILGLIWGLWHLPAFFIAGLPKMSLALPALLLGTLSISVIDTWIFLRSNGSLLPMIVVHLMTNHCFKMLGVSFGVTGAVGVVCAAAIVLSGGLRATSPARVQPAASATDPF